ncbi:MAG: MarR family transcriptional regulator [Chloroflexi bacterium]|nr:MarR family transcriptional regulator [Chloroflexota bacterium]
MKNDTFDDIIENLFNAHGFIHRKLLKGGLAGAPKIITRAHLIIMALLDRKGALPVTEIGRRTSIPKPQMTHLLDKLTALELVERRPDTADRRKINVFLTAKGKVKLDVYHKILRKNVAKKLSVLSNEELQNLLASLKALTEIGSKLG